ncbi:hypothetical protein [Vibrio harveyi]|uniref:hypothetical protein n=1 Tax=Vibrio harveyi TaxID=669 RepID=UPI0002F980A8|nr:hypothetical protein [Vibrio harveyi]
MFKPVKLEEFYVEYHYIVNIAFAKGTVYINEQQITIDGPSTLIIPQFTCLSCNLTQKSSFSPLQIQLLIVTDEMLESSLLQLPQKRSFVKNTVAHQLPTPVDVDNNFQLLKEVYDSLSRDALKIMFLEQTRSHRTNDHERTTKKVANSRCRQATVYLYLNIKKAFAEREPVI